MAAQSTTSTTLRRCTGQGLRILHVPGRSGWRLVSSRATVRSTRLKGSPRVLRVDLRGKSAGNYNVYIVARYTRAGKIKVVRSERHLSVACV